MSLLLEALLRDSLELLIALVLGLVLLIVWLLVRLARRTRARPDHAGAEAAYDSAVTKEAVDLTSPPPRADLKRSFSRARTAMRRAFAGGRAAAVRPWVLVLGPTESGKTTLMGRSGLGLPFGQPRQLAPPDHPGVNWWALDDGLVLDIVGEDVLRPDGMSSDRDEWRSILKRIRRCRPRRSIDGLVLTLPAGTLLDEAKPLAQRQAEAARRGALLSRKLAEAQRELGMRVPVFLLISHCDLVPGFASLLDSGAERGGQQMLGWSNPLSPTAPYSGALIDRAFRTLHEEIERFQLRALAKGAEHSRDRDSVLFPARFQELQAPLRVYANHLFGAANDSEPVFFRGLYFCGGRRRDDSEAAGPLAGEVAFVGDLFQEKVFPEAAVAQPTQRARTKAARRRAFFAAVTVAAGAWTAFGIGWGGRLSASIDGLLPFLDRIAERLDSPSAGATGERLVTSASDVSRFRLRSLALPGSSFSPLNRQLDRAVEEGFASLFRSARTALEEQTEELIATPATPDASRTRSGSLKRVSGGDSLIRDVVVHPIERYPEFTDLDEFSRDLASLDQAIAVYQRFSTEGSGTPATAVADFNRLSAATLAGDALRPGGTRPARYLGRRLATLRVPPFDHRKLDFDARLESKVLELTERFFDAIFDDNPLTEDLEEVLVRWIDGGPSWRPGPSEVESFRLLLASLQRTQRHLELPELQWTSAQRLDLGARFDAIRRRIHDSPFLGPEVSDGLSREAIARFDRLQEHLAIYGSGDTGVFLLREGETWELSPGLLAVLDGLEQVLGEPFMRGRCTPASVDQSLDGRTLFWRATPLENAVGLFAAYESWDGTEELPAPLKSTAPQVTREAMGANAVCLIADAQSFDYPVLAGGAEAIEDSIRQQVENLQAVQQTLQELLDALGRLELRAEQTRLAQILRSQRVHILGQLSELLDQQDLYTPLGGGFGWWQGDAAPALPAFDAATADELADYLATVRGIVGRLAAEYAQPTLGMFTGGLARLGPLQPVTTWQRIVAALADYGDKKPGSSLAALETLIGTIAADEAPQVFDLYSCFGDDLPATPVGTDFFARRGSALAELLGRRCRELADEKGYALYVELAKIFNDRLWGKFPFASADSSEGAAPEDIAAFFAADFANARLLIANLPAESEWFGDKKEPVRQFIERMEEARLFFASFLAVEAKSEIPIYDVGVKFRIERTKEQGANQIISWLMSLGEEPEQGDTSENGEKLIDLLNSRSVSPAPDEEPLAADGRWIYGRPVTLSFRWATGSRFSPYAPVSALPSQRWSLDGRTLRYRFREPWSLLRLLVKEKAPVAEFPDLRDPNPETVKLSIVTVSDDRPEPRAVADIYLQVTLLSPDENAELEMPEFHQLEAPLTQREPAGLTATDEEPEPAGTAPEAEGEPSAESTSSASEGSSTEDTSDTDSADTGETADGDGRRPGRRR